VEELNKCQDKDRGAAERQYQMLFNAITDGVGILGFSSSGKLDKFIEVNQNICRYTGYSKEELLNMRLIDLLEQSIPVEVELYGKLPTDGNFLFENTCKTKNGQRLPVEISASPFEVDGQAATLLIARDISKRKKAFDDLLLSEERFSKAFKFAPIMMAICRAKDGRLLCVNDNFVRVTGLQQRELLTKTIDEIGFSFGTGEHRSIIEYFRENDSLNNFEISLRDFKGEIRTYLLSAQIIRFSKQNAILLAVNDITERKLYQAELARLDRLNLVGAMAAEIGHEIRNPLTTVRGFLQMMKNEEKLPRRLEYYDVMFEELDQANKTITNFLTLAKDRRVDIRRANLNKLIECLLPLLKDEARKQGKKVVFKPGEIPLLPIDINEVKQLIRNLVNNGLEAMPKGGEVTISTYQQNGNIVIAVQDEGKGIPSDFIPKLGTPFFTTKENGIGLGLAVCYSIVARHRASLDIITSKKGTNVLVKFKAG